MKTKSKNLIWKGTWRAESIRMIFYGVHSKCWDGIKLFPNMKNKSSLTLSEYFQMFFIVSGFRIAFCIYLYISLIIFDQYR